MLRSVLIWLLGIILEIMIEFCLFCEMYDLFVLLILEFLMWWKCICVVDCFNIVGWILI